MKLSDIKGERTLEVIADIIDPIANIAESDAAKKLFRKAKLPEGMSKTAFAVKRIRAAVPELLRSNKTDIIFILATLAGQSCEEYAGKLSLTVLIRDLTELITDDVFVELFISAQTGGQSGSAQGNTGDR